MVERERIKRKQNLMNEIQMIDFIHDVLLKASEDTECFDYRIELEKN